MNRTQRRPSEETSPGRALQDAAAHPALQVGFERATLGVGMTDMDVVFTTANPALCAFFGRTEASVVGHSPYEFMDPEDAEQVAAPTAALIDGEIERYVFEARFLREDGTLVWGRVHLSTVVDDEGEGEYIFGQVEDITARKQAEAALEFQSLHDVLTGLPNRSSFSRRLEEMLDARRRNRSVAVLLIDLDEFRVINDAMGHDAGDAVLTEIAERLTGSVRGGDTVARFGGDEFVVLACVNSAHEAELLASRLRTRMRLPVQINGVDLVVSASIGVALAEPGSTTVELIRRADTAMYRAKQNGRDRIEIYTEAMGLQATSRLDNTLALARALGHGELSVAYQPVVRIEDEHFVGVEALVRWHDATRGWITPDEFIPLAEETGQILPIGSRVMRIALDDAQRVRSSVPGAVAMTVAVNLSARQFNDPDLPAAIRHALDRSDLPADALHLEITETAVMRDVDAALPILNELRTLGVHIDVDDFGTGYSSLSYLKRLPVTALKIDRAFVDGLGDDPDDTAIVTAIIALANALGLETIAEGVETPRQHEELRRLGCQFGQGFLWSEALDVAALEHWLRSTTLHAEPAPSAVT